MADTSVALLDKARNGDREALDALIARHVPRLRRWARGRLPRGRRDLADTDDLVQETLINTVRNIRQFVPRGDAAFEMYLRQALWNRIRDELRAARHRPMQVDDTPSLADPRPSALEEAVGKQALECYESGLRALSEEERDAIVGRFELGYDFRELARALGKFTPDAARKLVQRAVLRLTEHMRRGV